MKNLLVNVFHDDRSAPAAGPPPAAGRRPPTGAGSPARLAPSLAIVALIITLVVSLGPAQTCPDEDPPMNAMTLTSSAFTDGQPIPTKYTGDGQDVSPPLKWAHLPAGTRSLALIVDDPDAPRPQPWVHWVIYNLPLETPLRENIPHEERLGDPAEALQGPNTSNQIGYQGPAPPKGHGVHHYYFKLYALDAPLPDKPGMTKEQVLKAMDKHVLGEARLMGTYERK